jgi:hypothetical protein
MKTKKSTMEYNLYRYNEQTEEETETEVFVEHSYYPGAAATYWQPADDPDVEIYSIVDAKTKKEVEVTDKEYENIVTAIMEQREDYEN